MIVSGIASMTGLLHFRPPAEVMQFAQFFLGLGIGRQLALEQGRQVFGQHRRLRAVDAAAPLQEFDLSHRLGTLRRRQLIQHLLLLRRELDGLGAQVRCNDRKQCDCQ